MSRRVHEFVQLLSITQEGLSQVLLPWISDIARLVNRVMPLDGSEPMSRPLVLKSYTVATVPTAGDWTNGIIVVSDEAGGLTVAFSDGTNWRRVQDRAVVS